MRGYLTSWVSMCWGCGSFLASGVLRGSLGLPGDLAWRVPYALQWIWVVPLFVVGLVAPESPWYLVRRGRLEDAEKALRRLARKGHYTEQSMAETLALMKHTNEMEKIEAMGATYRDCFRGTNLRRTAIVCMAWIIQILNGQAICSYATIFLQSAGMPQVQAFNYNMGIQSVNIVGTAIAISLMGRIGRRVFFFCGSTSIGILMLVIGIMGFVPGAKNVALTVAIVLILVNLIFKLSLGPTTYTIVGEMSSSRVRAQTIVLGRAMYVVGQIILQQLNPRMLNDSADAWNWGAKAGMLYFGLCCIWAFWIFFFLPETKNRTFAELDYLFQKKVPARQFSTHPVHRKSTPSGSRAGAGGPALLTPDECSVRNHRAGREMIAVSARRVQGGSLLLSMFFWAIISVRKPLQGDVDYRVAMLGARHSIEQQYHIFLEICVPLKRLSDRRARLRSCGCGVSPRRMSCCSTHIKLAPKSSSMACPPLCSSNGRASIVGNVSGFGPVTGAHPVASGHAELVARGCNRYVIERAV